MARGTGFVLPAFLVEAGAATVTRLDVERAHAPVKADLLLGEDGFARAIRFVR